MQAFGVSEVYYNCTFKWTFIAKKSKVQLHVDVLGASKSGRKPTASCLLGTTYRCCLGGTSHSEQSWNRKQMRLQQVSFNVIFHSSALPGVHLMCLVLQGQYGDVGDYGR
eukprot:6472268-Amphidinium_carterae.1